MSGANPGHTNGAGAGHDAAEQAVLGALLIGGRESWDAINATITQVDFARPDHRLIFAAIAELAAAGNAHDVITVAEQLERRAQLIDAGGLAYLGTLAGDTPTAANARSYSQIVRERAVLRRLEQLGGDVCNRARSGQSADEIAGHARRMLDDIETALSDDAAAGWPEPVNLLEEMAAPAFTGEELPAVLARFPLAYARATGFDPSLTLTAATAAAAAALSDGFQIVGDSRSKWFQQPRLWMLDVARPGTGKTPAQKAMLAPLWDLQHEFRESHQQRSASLGEGEAAPPLPRLVIGDTTIEGLSEALKGNPRGILIANDEFESWLGSLDAYRRGGVSRDRGEWLRIFDGGPHAIERVQRGSVYVENWGASILTATTPAALAKLTRNLPEDGLLQRFLLIIGVRQREAQPTEDIEPARAQYHQLLRRLYAATPRAHSGCVPLSNEAQEFMRTWRQDATIAQEAFGAVEPALESHLAKYPNLLLRLALTFHAASVVSHDHEHARDPAAFPVSASTMQIAAKFLRRARVHAMAVYTGQKGGGEAFDVARSVARAILARGWDHVERRNLSRGIPAFRNAEDAQDAAIRLLVDLGWLRPSESGYRASQARFDVNPRLSAKFADVAERERKRRAVVREAITESVEARRSDRSEA